MIHPIHRVTRFNIVGPYTLSVAFADGTEQRIDFKPILHGVLFGPLQDLATFNAVTLDAEAGTLVWPNGADLDPATLHDWPQVRDELAARARNWVTGESDPQRANANGADAPLRNGTARGSFGTLGRREMTMKMTAGWLVVMAMTPVPFGSSVPFWSATQSQTASSSPLARQYREGERLVYRMTATNRDRAKTSVYTATARGVVKRDSAGTFFEEYEWTDIVWDGTPFDLPQASRGFRQLLSLAPNHTPTLPDFSTLHPRLVGPTTDLLTFYSDVWLAIRQPGLRQAGDRVRVNHGDANSWADGARILLGEDSIDFDIVLGEMATSSGTRELIVRHVPPEQPGIRIPAAWMRMPVADVPNNWVQVVKLNEGRYVASVGKETFDARIHLSLASGRIVSADLENPVEVFERECKDEALTQCGGGVRYRILRRIQIAEIP